MDNDAFKTKILGTSPEYEERRLCHGPEMNVKDEELKVLEAE